MAKNSFGKTKEIGSSYATYRIDNPNNGMYFEWKVLKTYQRPDKEKDNQYARWFCAVKSPMTYDSWELGDTYVKEILDLANMIDATSEWKEHYG